MKRLIIHLLVACLALTLIGCGGSDLRADEGVQLPAASGGDGMVTIGISQFVELGPFDAAREGFIAALAAAGYRDGENIRIRYENAAADTAVATQIAQNFASTGVDLVFAIATPSAQSAFNVLGPSGVPIVYGPLTDPVAAGVANKDGTNPGEITGVSSMIQLRLQAELIREILPDARRIGIVYTTSEKNSESSVAEYRRLADEFDFELELVGVHGMADVPGAIDALLGKVDCLANLTDSTVVASTPTIVDKALKADVALFGSERSQVELGALAAEGPDYHRLGEVAGEMAVRILKGEAKASEIPYVKLEETALTVNRTTSAAIGVPIPDSVLNRASEVIE